MIGDKNNKKMIKIFNVVYILKNNIKNLEYYNIKKCKKTVTFVIFIINTIK